MRRARLAYLSLALGVVTLTAACTVSEEDEREIGAYEAAQADSQVPLLGDTAITRYVTTLGRSMADRTSRAGPRCLPPRHSSHETNGRPYAVVETGDRPAVALEHVLAGFQPGSLSVMKGLSDIAGDPSGAAAAKRRLPFPER